jgi:L-asparagine transporter-like permease
MYLAVLVACTDINRERTQMTREPKMTRTLHRIVDPLLWLFLAWVLWTRGATPRSFEWMQTGYKVLALILVAVVVFDTASRLYFWREDKKLDAMTAKGNGA